MKRTVGLGFFAIFAASLLFSTSYYVLEVRGGSRIYALDRPVRKGPVVLFHRYPDGDYMSLQAGEVEKVAALEEPPQPDRLAPGQTVFVGPALEGPGYQAPPTKTAESAPAAPTWDSSYGYSGWYWGGGGYFPPSAPRPPQPAPPSRIGPNGFPILAPPGSPGSTPPPIGPNGFPVLSPRPPSVLPH